jgi:2-keto-myo-inositol isomerase
MTTHRIGLNLVTIKGGREADRLSQNLDCARRAGFQGVGLWVSTIEQWLTAGRSVEQLAREVNSRGLEVHELCFVPVLNEAGKVADQRRVFEWAAALAAPAVICIYGRPDNPLPKVRDDWAAFVGQVEDLGVAAAFEFIGAWKQYNSPLSAWEVIQAGPALGTMVFDTFHFWRGGCKLGQIGQVPAGRISLVHLNDVNDVPREKAGDSDRTFPGEGVMPLKEILGKLFAGGFGGPLSVEIFGPAQQQDPDEVSRRAYIATAALVESL